MANTISFRRFLETAAYTDQVYSDQSGSYGVGSMIDFARRNKRLQDIDVSDLLHNLEPSPHETGSDLPGHPEFVRRAERASLEHPIIVVRYPRENLLFVADGVHRLYKAVRDGQRTMRGYVIEDDELPQMAKA